MTTRIKAALKTRTTIEDTETNKCLSVSVSLVVLVTLALPVIVLCYFAVGGYYICIAIYLQMETHHAKNLFHKCIHTLNDTNVKHVFNVCL